MRKYQTKGNSLILLDLWECGLFEVSDFITLMSENGQLI